MVQQLGGRRQAGALERAVRRQRALLEVLRRGDSVLHGGLAWGTHDVDVEDSVSAHHDTREAAAARTRTL